MSLSHLVESYKISEEYYSNDECIAFLESSMWSGARRGGAAYEFGTVLSCNQMQALLDAIHDTDTQTFESSSIDFMQTCKRAVANILSTMYNSSDDNGKIHLTSYIFID
jgi:hypothetical protein